MSDDSNLLRRGYQFWQRHRRKTVLIAAVTGGVYAYNNSGVVKNAVDQGWEWFMRNFPLPADPWPEKQIRTAEDGSLLVKHPKETGEKREKNGSDGVTDDDSVIRTCLQLLEIGLKLMDELLDTERVRKEIVSSPEKKIALWEEIKIISWTKCFASVYTLCHLVVYIKAHTGVASSFLLEKSAETERDLHVKLQIMSQHVQGADFPVTSGLTALIKVVRSVVVKAVGPKSLQESLSMEDISRIVHCVRKLMERSNEDYDTYHHGYHMEFLVPSDHINGDIEREAFYRQPEDEALLELTQNLHNSLESVDCKMIMDCCLELCFSRFLKEMDLVLRDRFTSTVTDGRPALPHAVLLPAISRISNLFIKGADAEPLIKDPLERKYVQVNDLTSRERMTPSDGVDGFHRNSAERSILLPRVSCFEGFCHAPVPFSC